MGPSSTSYIGTLGPNQVYDHEVLVGLPYILQNLAPMPQTICAQRRSWAGVVCCLSEEGGVWGLGFSGVGFSVAAPRA